MMWCWYNMLLITQCWCEITNYVMCTMAPSLRSRFACELTRRARYKLESNVSTRRACYCLLWGVSCVKSLYSMAFLLSVPRWWFLLTRGGASGDIEQTQLPVAQRSSSSSGRSWCGWSRALHRVMNVRLGISTGTADPSVIASVTAGSLVSDTLRGFPYPHHSLVEA